MGWGGGIKKKNCQREHRKWWRGLSQRIIASLSQRLAIEEGEGASCFHVCGNRKQEVLEEVNKVKAALALFAPEAQELHSLGGAANGAYFFGIFQRQQI